ncbi:MULTISPECIES: restriction endonuclease subunit S [Prevotellaceae]|uniref:restriction endonuclease subunit S n=1 Tax=Prevotellaceae TaxID=171552 RepID=UPI0013149753|nr:MULTISPECIES: restriction endonuclease subunit S [Prevotellaceae]
MEQVNSPWGFLPRGWRLSTIDEEKERLTDYVANGSFASLASNVHYKDTEDYAVLIRLVDFNNDFKGPFVYIDEHAYSFLSKSSLSGGEIIISNVGANVGTVFKCPNLPYKMSLAPNAITIKLKGDNDFYYYWFKSKIGQANIQALVTGSAQPKFNKTNFRSMYIPVPPLDVQRRIASILSSLDRKIELNNKINADLEEMAQAIFKNWFVDFEPFKNGKFVDSELGMIPEGWKVGRLDEIADVVGGSTPSKAKPEYYTQKGIAWLTPKDLSNHPAVYTSRGEIDITEEGYNSTSTKLMPKGTILFTSRAPIGYISIAQNDICTNQGFKSLVPKKAGTCFLYCFLKYVTPEIENKSTGSTFKEASGSLMKSLQVLMPEQKVFEDFETIVSPLFARIEFLEKESSRLSLLRDTLLPRLMSGELEVPE